MKSVSNVAAQQVFEPNGRDDTTMGSQWSPRLMTPSQICVAHSFRSGFACNSCVILSGNFPPVRTEAPSCQSISYFSKERVSSQTNQTGSNSSSLVRLINREPFVREVESRSSLYAPNGKGRVTLSSASIFGARGFIPRNANNSGCGLRLRLLPVSATRAF